MRFTTFVFRQIPSFFRLYQSFHRKVLVFAIFLRSISESVKLGNFSKHESQAIWFKVLFQYLPIVKSCNFGVIFAYNIFFLRNEYEYFYPLWCRIKSGPKCWHLQFWILPTFRPLFNNFFRQRSYCTLWQFRQYSKPL